MIGVDKIEDTRKRARRGEGVAGISRATGVSEPTVRKRRDMDDLSPERPAGRGAESPTPGPRMATIDRWLEEDLRCWRKQRHTAKRVFGRLVEEEGRTGSRSTVQRRVRRRKEEMRLERDARDAQGYLDLDWLPGECQVDFGEADFRVRGVVTRGRYLTVSFPHSNVGITQVFWGETSECVCQGPGNVFEFVGGVPRRVVFDNATEVGRRFGAVIHTSSMFRLFAAHYGIDYAFTSPCSGNEKGNVECKVGFTRRNMFVPVPAFSDVRGFNARLMRDCLAESDGKPHWRLGTPELELFEGDRAELSPLPPQGFSCVRWETRKCGKQGAFAVGGIHRRFAGPAYARKEVAVALGAFDVTVVDEDTGEEIASREREWGDAPTSSSDPVPRLKLLCPGPGGWRDSTVRKALPGELVSFLDSQGPRDLAADLRALRDASAERGWAAAVEGMSRTLELTGGLDAASVSLEAAVAASGDARVDYDGGDAGLGSYDVALRLVRGGGRDAAGQLGA